MIHLNAKTYRHWETHDDMQGIVGTAIGASALGTITIRDTGFPILCFQNLNDDVVYFQYQMPHAKKLGTPVDSVHLHCYLPAAPGAGNTLIFNWEWTWYNNGALIPATASWNKDTYTYTFVGTEAQYSTLYIPIITNLAAPANETYSSILLVKITRDSTGPGSDTYNADLGIVYTDAHIIKDRWGSLTEGSD